jgi:hypothetical protein
MLRITWSRGPAGNRLRAAGEIAGPESRVFWAECERGRSEPRFEIDLGGVTYVENADADRLRDLAHSGVQLFNCPAFLWALLHYPAEARARPNKAGRRKLGPKIL